MEQQCCCTNSLYPWAKKPFYEPSIDGLNEQITHFLDWVAPTEEEQIMRKDVCSRVEQTVKELWPQAAVETYGSTSTNLCVPSSDIDMVIFGVAGQNNTQDSPPTTESLYMLAKHLEKVAVKNSVEVFITAKVPIIKMRDVKSGIEVDLSFGVLAGKENTKVILDYCEKFPLARPLALIIKYYLKQKSLNNSWSGGIGSYTLIIMIISYLQLHNKEENPSLVDLLFGFFRLYGDQFDYVEHVISIADDGRYLNKTEKNWKNENCPHLLSVEDPHNPDNDVGCIAFKIENAKEAFYQAYNLLADTKSHSSSSCSGNEEKDDEQKSQKLRPELMNTSVHSFGKRPDLTLSQLMWVNYSLHCFREKIKQMYSEPGVTLNYCPIHLNHQNDYNHNHNHNHKNYGKNKSYKYNHSRSHQHNNNNQNYKYRQGSHYHNINHNNKNNKKNEANQNKNSNVNPQPTTNNSLPINPYSSNFNPDRNQNRYKVHKIVTTDYPALSSAGPPSSDIIR